MKVNIFQYIVRGQLIEEGNLRLNTFVIAYFSIFDFSNVGLSLNSIVRDFYTLHLDKRSAMDCPVRRRD